MTIQESEYYTEEHTFAILRRIKYPVKNPNVLTEPTLDTLCELQYRCVTSVPSRPSSFAQSNPVASTSPLKASTTMS